MKANKKTPISKNSNLGELISDYPHLAQTLVNDYHLHCATCFAASFETLEEGAKAHGLSDEEIDDMIACLIKIDKNTKK
jgi:hybrid cluster-associated redox disulfide protein